MPLVGVLKQDSEVESSLLYCAEHVIPDGYDGPAHERTVIDRALLSQWQWHIARKYPSLLWSKQIMAERDAQLEADMDTPLADRLNLKAAAPAALAATAASLQSGKASATGHAVLEASAGASATSRKRPASEVAQGRPVKVTVTLPAKKQPVPLVPQQPSKAGATPLSAPHNKFHSSLGNGTCTTDASSADKPCAMDMPAKPAASSSLRLTSSSGPATTKASTPLTELHGPGRPTPPHALADGQRAQLPIADDSAISATAAQNAASSSALNALNHQTNSGPSDEPSILASHAVKLAAPENVANVGGEQSLQLTMSETQMEHVKQVRLLPSLIDRTHHLVLANALHELVKL